MINKLTNTHLSVSARRPFGRGPIGHAVTRTRVEAEQLSAHSVVFLSDTSKKGRRYWNVVFSSNGFFFFQSFGNMNTLTKQALVPRSFLHWASRVNSLPGSILGRDSSSCGELNRHVAVSPLRKTREKNTRVSVNGIGSQGVGVEEVFILTLRNDGRMTRCTATIEILFRCAADRSWCTRLPSDTSPRPVRPSKSVAVNRRERRPTCKQVRVSPQSRWFTDFSYGFRQSIRNKV